MDEQQHTTNCALISLKLEPMIHYAVLSQHDNEIVLLVLLHKSLFTALTFVLRWQDFNIYTGWYKNKPPSSFCHNFVKH